MEIEAKSKKGLPVVLSTDDTFTLAIGSFSEDYQESTPQSLAALLPVSELKRLRRELGPDSRASSKLDEAIEFAEK